MTNVKVAVIGFGVMGQYHANNYAAMQQVDLVAVVDPDVRRRVHAEKTFGCRSYGTVSELLAGEEISAASVAAPTSSHFAVTTGLLDAGIHALVEKPLAPTVEEARKLVAQSEAEGLVLQVGHITRFYEAVQLLNRIVGSPYLIEARRLTSNARIRDVGVVLDLMIHDIDIILRLVPPGSKIVDASVAGHSFENGPLEDVAAAQLVFDNGCIARLLASRVAVTSERNLMVMEHNQTVTLDFSRDPHTELAVYRPGSVASGTGLVEVNRYSIEEDNPLRRELEHFIARTLQETEPVGTTEDDLRSIGVAARLLDNMRTARLDELEEAFR